MKRSADLSITTYKKTFFFMCENILLVFFSLIIAALLTIGTVHAEVASEKPSTVISDALTSAAPTPVAPITETSVQAIAPLANTSPTTINTNINANNPPLADPKKISSASQLASLVGGLILIVGLIYGLSWFVKRFSQGGFMQNSTIKMLSAMPLGTRERIMLVDVGGKQILLGITATSINTLHVFEVPVVNTAEDVTPAPSDFSKKLMALLQKNTALQQHKELQENTDLKKNTAQQNDLSNSTFSNLKNTKK